MLRCAAAAQPEGNELDLRYGIGIGGPLRTIAGLAGAAEAAGFESCWTGETTATASVQAAAAASGTRRITIGTSIAVAFARSPALAAMEAADLDELSGGRFILGLGSQVKRVNQDRFSVPFEHPVAKLKEYVAVLRTVWAANRGEQATFEGRFYRCTMPVFGEPRRPPPGDVPVYLAAVGPVMARAAGEVADGVLAHPLASPAYLAEVVRPAVERGLDRAGRAGRGFTITASPLVSISDDVDLARREIKLQIAFYATTRTYRPILELHGRAGLIPALRAAHGRRDLRRMIELVDDELCDEIACAGPPADVRDRIRRWEPVSDRVILAGPWYGPSPERAADNLRALLEVFGPAVRTRAR